MIKEAKEAIFNYDEDAAKEVAEKAIKEGIDLVALINEGFTAGINELGELFAKEEVSLPEVMCAADALNAAVAILEPHLPKDSGEKKGVIVIGTVEADIHDIGKNIVATMLKVSGFEVIDIGRDQKAEAFVEAAKKYNADIVASSALMTTTMPGQAQIEELLRKEGIRDKVKTLLGGAPVNKDWVAKIGADGFANDANGAVKAARELLS